MNMLFALTFHMTISYVDCSRYWCQIAGFILLFLALF